MWNLREGSFEALLAATITVTSPSTGQAPCWGRSVATAWARWARPSGTAAPWTSTASSGSLPPSNPPVMWSLQELCWRHLAVPRLHLWSAGLLVAQRRSQLLQEGNHPSYKQGGVQCWDGDTDWVTGGDQWGRGWGFRRYQQRDCSHQDTRTYRSITKHSILLISTSFHFVHILHILWINFSIVSRLNFYSDWSIQTLH